MKLFWRSKIIFWSVFSKIVNSSAKSFFLCNSLIIITTIHCRSAAVFYKSIMISLYDLHERKAFISFLNLFSHASCNYSHVLLRLWRFSKITRNWVESVLDGLSRVAVGGDDTTRSCISGSHRQTWFPWISKSNASLSASTRLSKCVAFHDAYRKKFRSTTK